MFHIGLKNTDPLPICSDGAAHFACRRSSTPYERRSWASFARLVFLCYAAFQAAGCDIMQSPRMKVVDAAHRAVCEQRDFMAMAPFVTERSQVLLKLVKSMADLAKVVGVDTADRIAVDCARGHRQTLLDEVQVSETRYIVRTTSEPADRIQEYVLVKEGDHWRIALFGR